MSKPTLVILAAGMASRYGSMKQVEGFGPPEKRLWTIPFLMPYGQDLEK
jgi:uncharacterized membrane protein (DUF2068 family)